jgi:hypothetical protein
MTNYTANVGTQYKRAAKIEIENTAIPTALFVEEDVMQLATGEVYRTSAGYIQLSYVATDTITLVAAITGLPVGSVITQADIQVIMDSFYLQAALARDAVAETAAPGVSAAPAVSAPTTGV